MLTGQKIAPTLHHVREDLFPDWGLRPESEELSAAFDPFNLQLKPGVDRDIADEVDALLAGDFETAGQIARPKLGMLPRSERVEYMLRVTQCLHELRHFHDHFGTTAGFKRVLRTLDDGIQFYTLWDQLKQLGTVCLPLSQWARQSDAPNPLHNYAKKRRAYIEWFNLYDGPVFPSRPELAERAAHQPVIAMCFDGLQTVLPSVSIKAVEIEIVQELESIISTRIKGRCDRIVPLGCNVLMEGVAFAVQREIVRRLFGPEAAEDVQSWMRYRAPLDRESWRYTALEVLIGGKIKKNFYSRYQIALADTALMPAPDQKSPDDHPGVRTARLLGVAAKNPELLAKPTGDLASWAARLTRQLGWPNPRIVASRAFQMYKDALSRPSHSALDTVVRACVAMHHEFLAKRLEKPGLLADPTVWLGNFTSLPPPPILFENGLLAVVADQQPDAFALWYFCEHFQRNTLFGTTLPCAIPSPHDCPGDPLSIQGWKPRETCPFSQFLGMLGISTIKVNRLHI